MFWYRITRWGCTIVDAHLSKTYMRMKWANHCRQSAAYGQTKHYQGDMLMICYEHPHSAFANARSDIVMLT